MEVFSDSSKLLILLEEAPDSSVTSDIVAAPDLGQLFLLSQRFPGLNLNFDVMICDDREDDDPRLAPVS